MKATTGVETKRAAIRKKVANSGADLAKQTPPAKHGLPDAEPPEGLKALAVDYPFALVLGGMAVGVIAGAFIPRIAGGRLARSAMFAASIAGEMGLAYGKRALRKVGEASGEGRVRLEKLGDSLSEGAVIYGRKASDVVSQAGEKTSVVAGEVAGSARGTGMKLAKKVLKLGSQLRD